MTKYTLAVAFSVACVVGVAAQSDLFSGFHAFKDDIVPGPNACGSAPRSIAATVYERHLTVVSACEDGRLIVRTFLRANDNAIPPTPVYLVPMPGVPAGQPTPGVPPSGDGCSQNGLVPGIYGGCVPRIARWRC